MCSRKKKKRRQCDMDNKFSVLMSLYIKEKPENLIECMESILNQTVKADEIVIVKDGPLTDELENTLSKYINENPKLYTIVPLEKNVGLGLALAEGISHCKNELVARMDTDDIARNDRFEKQLAEFEKNPALDICGSHILEFEDDVKNIVAQRKVPLDDKSIKEYQKKRDSFNHMTVMYKKSSVLKAGNYQSCMLMEDTLLWVNMILSGATCANVDDFLAYARIGKGMYERRGGWAYFKKYKQGRKRVRETGYIGFFDYYYTLLVQFGVAIMPNKVRGFVFKKILHR